MTYEKEETAAWLNVEAAYFKHRGAQGEGDGGGGHKETAEGLGLDGARWRYLVRAASRLVTLARRPANRA